MLQSCSALQLIQKQNWVCLRVKIHHWLSLNVVVFNIIYKRKKEENATVVSSRC